ncbi:DUF3060 domain-containing protein [Mycolicibacter terrae]|uniref:DUF3060 domain-containing protein n=2 Tax=Mycolicibacter TaxID=1073531 RepID=A0A1A2P1Y5_MYCSD|nr:MULTISPECIES: DUF3060 domain-containing protein [Mycolicibacter]OBH21330.1 hypothetical protein A5694_13385 [Mycolicibacter sinensis]OBI29276.1 hypothetical protein A5710_22040 [Mycolicibacter sinensis]RRR43716.1 DUF3060 domain-containing protein [Mycolicibacter terrae]
MTRRAPLVVGVAITTLLCGLTGCAGSPEVPPVRRLPASADPNLIDYGSVGTTSAVDCADGKSLLVAGSNNKLTVRGRCEAVNVAGADNRITVERVEKSLTVTGLNNSVTYRGGEPTVDDRGSGNTIAGKR